MEYTKLKNGISFGKLSEMIEGVVITEGYKNIKNEVFAGYYTNLEKIICPTTLTNAGYRCFSCSNVKEFILNNGLQSIGDEGFSRFTTNRRNYYSKQCCFHWKKCF